MDVPYHSVRLKQPQLLFISEEVFQIDVQHLCKTLSDGFSLRLSKNQSFFGLTVKEIEIPS